MCVSLGFAIGLSLYIGEDTTRRFSPVCVVCVCLCVCVCVCVYECAFLRFIDSICPAPLLRTDRYQLFFLKKEKHKLQQWTMKKKHERVDTFVQDERDSVVLIPLRPNQVEIQLVFLICFQIQHGAKLC